MCTQVLIHTVLYFRFAFVFFISTIFLIFQSPSKFFSTRFRCLNFVWNKLIDLKLEFLAAKNFRFLKTLDSAFRLTLFFCCQKSIDFEFKVDCKSKDLCGNLNCNDQALWNTSRWFNFNDLNFNDLISSISLFDACNLNLCWTKLFRCKLHYLLILFLRNDFWMTCFFWTNVCPFFHEYFSSTNSTSLINKSDDNDFMYALNEIFFERKYRRLLINLHRWIRSMNKTQYFSRQKMRLHYQ